MHLQQPVPPPFLQVMMACCHPQRCLPRRPSSRRRTAYSQAPLRPGLSLDLRSSWGMLSWFHDDRLVQPSITVRGTPRVTPPQRSCPGHPSHLCRTTASSGSEIWRHRLRCGVDEDMIPASVHSVCVESHRFHIPVSHFDVSVSLRTKEICHANGALSMFVMNTRTNGKCVSIVLCHNPSLSLYVRLVSVTFIQTGVSVDFEIHKQDGGYLSLLWTQHLDNVNWPCAKGNLSHPPVRLLFSEKV